LKDDERKVLADRFNAALAEADARSVGATVRALGAAAAGSKAVIARPLREVDRLATGDREGYSTYYQLIEAGVRYPAGDAWDYLRRVADEALFTGYREELRFAALSLTDTGLSSYGEFSIVLGERMIAHRASLFDENTAVFAAEQRIKDVPTAARGHRSAWETRDRLCVAKLASSVDVSTTTTDFPRLVLQKGSTSADDQFVEVQIWGPMTVRTFEKVVYTGPGRRPSKAIMKALRERLKNAGVALEER
jgi:hypothetical protein